ncbi:DUF5050 domain-containing protein [Clostridium oceanicum]|uniref:DUF5050 domain-containing protein n=1 Tax=Clostridium oceanicum TaxID=1543 RepID=A0ABP3V057_9CLOT
MKFIKKLLAFLLIFTLVNFSGIFNFNNVLAKDKIFEGKNVVKHSIPRNHAVLKDYNENLYNDILEALRSMKTYVETTSYTLNSDKAFDVLETVLDDHPEIFYFNTQDIGFISNGERGSLELKYNYNSTTVASMKKSFQSKIDEILSSLIRDDMSYIEKEIAIHDYIVLNTTYDTKNIVSENSYTAYGALIENVAVCDGYAKAMQILLNKVGIKTIRVTGTSQGESHAWNIVNIYGKNYHVDSTWNDPVPDKGYSSYKYLNLSDNEIEKDHKWDRSKYPKCDDKSFDYLHAIRYPVVDGQWIYYSNEDDDYKMYRIDLNGQDNQKLTEDSAIELAQYKDYVFFSNYSDSGYLYKIRKDNLELKLLEDDFVTNIHVKDDYLNYYNNFESVNKKINLKTLYKEKENIEEFNKRFKDYKKLQTKEGVATNKTWTVNFNHELKDQDFKDKIYVLDSSFNKVSKVSISKEGKKAIIKPQDNYKQYGIYYIVVESTVENKDGQNIKVPTVMKFTT